jgi:hypothetical protein
VRNTQPRRSVIRNPAKRGQRRSARSKLKTFGYLLAASSGVDNAEDSMIDKMTKDRAQRPAETAFLQAHKQRRGVTEYEKAQEAFQKNYERLRAERLAREAAKPKQK